MLIHGLHHIAIICSDYEVSKTFYTQILEFEIVSEIYRVERFSYKLNLKVPGGGEIELFSFPHPPKRVSRPEACGIRHLAFLVHDIEETVMALVKKGIEVEKIRRDEVTQKRFTFFADPDDLPIEIYEK